MNPMKVQVNKLGQINDRPKTVELCEKTTAREVLEKAGIDPEDFSLINPANGIPIEDDEPVSRIIDDGVTLKATPKLVLG